MNPFSLYNMHRHVGFSTNNSYGEFRRISSKFKQVEHSQIAHTKNRLCEWAFFNLISFYSYGKLRGGTSKERLVSNGAYRTLASQVIFSLPNQF